MASLRPIETPITPGSWHPGSSSIVQDRDRERLGDSRIPLDSRIQLDPRLMDNNRTTMEWPERDRRKQTALAGPGTGAPGMFNFSYFSGHQIHFFSSLSHAR